MKKIILPFLLLLYNTFFAQVGINTATPDASAMLDIRSIDKGLLIPRMTLTEKTAILLPANGLLVYQTDGLAGFWYYNGSSWVSIGSAGASTNWSLTGNATTNPATNFIGTTDNQPLLFRTNNANRIRISTKGQIETLNTGNSVFIGEGAGQNDDMTNNDNIFVGLNAGNTNTTGFNNNAIGRQALLANISGSNNVAIGTTALRDNTSANANVAVGGAALQRNNGEQNTAVGATSLLNNNSGGFNSALGRLSLFGNTTGSQNVGLGFGSGQNNTTGSDNTFLGSNANPSASNLDNATAIGRNTVVNASNKVRLGNDLVTATDAAGVFTYNAQDVANLSVAFPNGRGTNGQVLTTDGAGLTSWTTVSGAGDNLGNHTAATTLNMAANNITNANNLTATGTATLGGNTYPTVTGTNGQVLTTNGSGATAWTTLLTASNDWTLTGNAGTNPANNFVGTTDNQPLLFRTNNANRLRITTKGQLETLNTGSSVFVGENAGANDDLSANLNTFVGFSAGQTNTTGSRNAFVGYQTGINNTTGANNTAMGEAALFMNTLGTANTAIGQRALVLNTTASNNIALGVSALETQSFSNAGVAWNSNNTAIGAGALFSNQPTATTNGINNTAIGTGSLRSNTTGFNNSVLGLNAMYFNTTGASNIALGVNAGLANTVGNNNTFVGNGSNATANNLTNATAIGFGAVVDASNTVRLGNDNVTATDAAGVLTYNVQSASSSVTFPNGRGTNGQVLTTDGAGLTSWTTLTAGGNGWSLLGNAGTNPATNFVGTTDNQPLIFRTNNTEKIRVTTKGQIETLNTGESVFIGETAGANDDLSSNQNVLIGFQAGQGNSTGNANTVIGYQAMRYGTGSSNTAIGWKSLLNSISGNSNTAVGESALWGNTAGSRNVALGVATLYTNNAGTDNIGIGFNALFENNGSSNIGIGSNSLSQNTGGTHNIAVGTDAMRAARRFGQNIAIGSNALRNHDLGGFGFWNTNNIAIGFNSLVNNIPTDATNGLNNTALGVNTGSTNVTGINNTFLGFQADLSSNNLNNATAVGANAIVNASNKVRLGNDSVTATDAAGVLSYNVQGGNSVAFPNGRGSNGQVLTTDGAGQTSWITPTSNAWSLLGNSSTNPATNFIGTTDNQPLIFRTNNLLRTRISTKGQIEPLNTGESVFLGERAGQNDDLSTNQNVWLGFEAGQVNTTGSANTAVGYQALRGNTIGVSNVAMGWKSLVANMNGNYNIAAGENSLGQNISGDRNIALGRSTLFINNGGEDNIAIGDNALYANNSTDNIGIGTNALRANMTGDDNLAVGSGALTANTFGNYNLALGSNAGSANTTGNNNIFIGFNANASANNLSNAIAIGTYTQVNASNKVRIGNDSVTATDAAGVLTYNAQSASNSVAFPNGRGLNGQVLTTNGSGLTSWTTPTSNSWSLLGNAGTNPATNFVGTTDDVSLRFRVNNTTAGRIGNSTQQSTFFGYQAGDISNNPNTGFGFNALRSASNATSCTNNTAIGVGTLELLDNSGFNTAVGHFALNKILTAFNTAVGTNALSNSTIGLGRNTAIGFNAGTANVMGNNNTYLGSEANASGDGISNATAIGANTIVNASNKVRLGNNSVTATDAAGVLTYNVQSTSSSVAFPNGRGLNGQVLTTDGAGLTSWTTVAAGGSTETASNGLTKTGNDIQLGGNLTANTTITQNAAEALTIANNGTANTTINLQNTGDFVVQNAGVSAFQVLDDGSVNAGTSNQFRMNATGNITRINNVVTSFPAAQGAANTVLRNDGAGNLSWTANNNWTTTGNAGTVEGTNFLGNTDDVALEFRVNNQRAGYVGNSTNYNAFFGHRAGESTTTGDGNVFMGKEAGRTCTTGGANVAIGQAALRANNGNFNVAVGISALINQTTGAQNVAVGGSAGSTVTTGSYNILMGTSADVSSATRTYGGAFGTNAISDADYRIRIGGGTHTSIGGPVGFTNFSDQRFKFNVQNNVQGIDFIKRLNPVSYQFDYDELHKFYQKRNKAIPNAPKSKGNEMIQVGFMAQDIEKLCKEMNFDFGAVDKPDDINEGIYGLRYTAFVPVLVKAVQEQQAQIETLKTENNQLKQKVEKIDEMQAQINELKEMLLKLKK